MINEQTAEVNNGKLTIELDSLQYAAIILVGESKLADLVFFLRPSELSLALSNAGKAKAIIARPKICGRRRHFYSDALFLRSSHYTLRTVL